MDFRGPEAEDWSTSCSSCDSDAEDTQLMHSAMAQEYMKAKRHTMALLRTPLESDQLSSLAKRSSIGLSSGGSSTLTSPVNSVKFSLPPSAGGPGALTSGLSSRGSPRSFSNAEDESDGEAEGEEEGANGDDLTAEELDEIKAAERRDNLEYHMYMVLKTGKRNQMKEWMRIHSMASLKTSSPPQLKNTLPKIGTKGRSISGFGFLSACWAVYFCIRSKRSMKRKTRHERLTEHATFVDAERKKRNKAIEKEYHGHSSRTVNVFLKRERDTQFKALTNAIRDSSMRTRQAQLKGRVLSSRNSRKGRHPRPPGGGNDTRFQRSQYDTLSPDSMRCEAMSQRLPPALLGSPSLLETSQLHGASVKDIPSPLSQSLTGMPQPQDSNQASGAGYSILITETPQDEVTVPDEHLSSYLFGEERKLSASRGPSPLPPSGRVSVDSGTSSPSRSQNRTANNSRRGKRPVQPMEAARLRSTSLDIPPTTKDANVFVFNPSWVNLDYQPVEDRIQPLTRYSKQTHFSPLYDFTRTRVPNPDLKDSPPKGRPTETVNRAVSRLPSIAVPKIPLNNTEKHDSNRSSGPQSARLPALHVSSTEGDAPQPQTARGAEGESGMKPKVPKKPRSDIRKSVAAVTSTTFDFGRWRRNQNSAISARAQERLEDGAEGHEADRLQMAQEAARKRADVFYDDKESAVHSYDKFIVHKAMEHADFITRSNNEGDRVIAAKRNLIFPWKREAILKQSEAGKNFYSSLGTAHRTVAERTEQHYQALNQQYNILWMNRLEQKLMGYIDVPTKSVLKVLDVFKSYFKSPAANRHQITLARRREKMREEEEKRKLREHDKGFAAAIQVSTVEKKKKSFSVRSTSPGNTELGDLPSATSTMSRLGTEMLGGKTPTRSPAASSLQNGVGALSQGPESARTVLALRRVNWPEEEPDWNLFRNTDEVFRFLIDRSFTTDELSDLNVQFMLLRMLPPFPEATPKTIEAVVNSRGSMVLVVDRNVAVEEQSLLGKQDFEKQRHRRVKQIDGIAQTSRNYEARLEPKAKAAFARKEAAVRYERQQQDALQQMLNQAGAGGKSMRKGNAAGKSSRGLSRKQKSAVVSVSATPRSGSFQVNASSAQFQGNTSGGQQPPSPLVTDFDLGALQLTSPTEPPSRSPTSTTRKGVVGFTGDDGF